MGFPICIDCSEFLVDSNRSSHQPKIRCKKCFAKFSGDVENTLNTMIADLKSQETKR